VEGVICVKREVLKERVGLRESCGRSNVLKERAVIEMSYLRRELCKKRREMLIERAVEGVSCITMGLVNLL